MSTNDTVFLDLNLGNEDCKQCAMLSAENAAKQEVIRILRDDVTRVDKKLAKERERADAWVTAVVEFARELSGDPDFLSDSDGGRAWGFIQKHVKELKDKLAAEQRAAMSIAVACGGTGAVPPNVDGTVDAVKAVCSRLAKLEKG